MSDASRCCGSGTCIIDSQGHCWCGQRWDGEKMCPAQTASSAPAVPGSATESKSSRLVRDAQASFPGVGSGAQT